MSELQMGVIEAQFANIIWECEPVSGAELVKKAEAAFNWKRTTAYTVLKRLCDKGIFQNDGGTVRVVVGRDAYYGAQSEQFVQETFSGSLPAFLAAFTSRKKLTPQEVAALNEMIDSYEEDAP